ncbi:GntR family transcriptional regulator [Saccharopolyspora sp. NPDC047091]|uniref:GntR family transcriptional regulator n=1 Tax=Saccharopolyspora sp. NPDC047091 TaxID=3155924 RepID=UPI0033D6A1A9
MASTGRGARPPYRVIAGEVRARIRSGELRPGDRVPSIRQLAQRWGVAIATATRAAALLREEGLVEPKVGAGTVVSARAVAAPAAPERRAHARRATVLDAAIAIADAEGLDAVSMRRLAAQLGIGPMSLYRVVADKEELVARMADRAFAGCPLPATGPPGWRAKLELAARAEWELCRAHLWLPRAISLTRPSFAPHLMAHTEWILGVLAELGLPPRTRLHEALALHSLVLASASSMAAETDAEQRTGLPLGRWRSAQRSRAGLAVDGTRFPLLAAVPEGAADDLAELFEYGLARHLDGFAALVAGR